MAKENTFYFSHDYNARLDDKIKRLIRSHGMSGYGVFWSIIEDLYNNANALPTDYEGIAYDLRVDKSLVENIVTGFDLFVVLDGNFGSTSVERRLNERAEKSKKAQDSANNRWKRVRENATAQESDANALRPECDSNAIKESKGKENKEDNTEPTALADYSAIPKDGVSIQKFIKDKKPTIPTPYIDLWNLFAEKNGCSKVAKVSDSRKRKLRVRLNDNDFDFPVILGKAKQQEFALKGKWFTFDWLIENDTNYLKILEMKYLQKDEASKDGVLSKVNYDN